MYLVYVYVCVYMCVCVFIKIAHVYVNALARALADVKFVRISYTGLSLPYSGATTR